MAHHHHHRGGLFHRIVRQVEHLHNPKRVIRGQAKQLVYTNRIGGAVVSLAAGYFGGAVAGEVVAGAFAEGGGVLRRIQARNEGLTGRDARAKGNAERKREFIIDSAAAGGGAVSSGVTTALAGGTAGQSITAVGVGQGGQSVLGTGPGILSTAQVATGGAPAGAVSAGGVVAGGVAPAAGGGIGLGTIGTIIAAVGGGTLSYLTAQKNAQAAAAALAAQQAQQSSGGGGSGGGGDSSDPGQLIKDAGNWIQEHPLLAIGGGLAVGFLLWKVI